MAGRPRKGRWPRRRDRQTPRSRGGTGAGPRDPLWPGSDRQRPWRHPHDPGRRHLGPDGRGDRRGRRKVGITEKSPTAARSEVAWAPGRCPVDAGRPMMSFAVSLRRLQVLAVFVGLVAVMLLAADRAAADEEGGGEDNPPALGFTEVTPSSLGYEGGNVQIQAEVTDDVGVGTVYAEIYGPNGNQAIQLFEGFEHNYFGTLEVPANYSESSVEIQAYDTNNAYIASLIGGVQVEAAPQFDEAPYITATEMFPQVLPSEGGQVTIRANAGDNRSLSGIFVMVSLPGGGSTEIGMYAISSDQFEGTFTAPPNSGPLAAEYVVEVVAQDDIGQEARASAGTI